MQTDTRRWIIVATVVTLVVVVAASFLASGDPDGLERVAEDQGFMEAGEEAPYEIIPDYTVPGIDGELSTLLAGVIGVAVMFVLVWGLGRLLARRRDDRATEPR
jgi:cobalt/nickel transport system permease protein